MYFIIQFLYIRFLIYVWIKKKRRFLHLFCSSEKSKQKMKLILRSYQDINRLPSILALLCLSVIVLSCDANGQDQETHEATHTAADEVQWGPTPFGPEASPVSGDFSAGAHVTFMRIKGGIQTPLHLHSHSYVGIVVSGTMRHWLPGFPETEKDLPAGSHWSIPANAEHISACLEGEDCIAAVIQDEFFDFTAVEDN